MFAKFAVLLISLNLCSGTKHEIVTKTFQFPNKKLILAETSLNEKTLVYALCAQPPRQCTVVQDANPFVKSSPSRKCDVNLLADNVQLIVAFGLDKAIVVTQESTSKSTDLKMTLIHMPSCAVTAAKLCEIPENFKDTQMFRQHMDVVVFQDGFEVIIKGLGQICNKHEQRGYCSVKFNADGKQNEGPIIWPKTPYRLPNISTSIIADKLGRYYFFIDHNVTLIGVQMLSNGDPVYRKLWGPMELHNGYWSAGFSIANDAYGTCYTEDSTVRCWQTNLLDERELDKEFKIRHQHDTWNIYVHNLRKGGFVVLMVNCPNRICAGIEDQYYFMKIDAQGKMMGHLDINFLSSCNAKNGKIIAKIFENEQGLYCAARLCGTQLQGIENLEMIVHCFSDDHFSK